MKRTNLLVSAVLGAAMIFAGCNGKSADSKEAAPVQAEKEEVSDVAAPGEEAGFTEIPIFEDAQVSFLNLSAVYFQPVPMSNGNGDISKYNIHLEADIAALENDLGFGVGDWVPYLTVDYAITSSNGEAAASGTFMEMSASDGPHYGANVALPNADTYDVTFTIHSPEENGYLVHTDAATGPGGTFDKYFGNGNLTYTFKGWEYTPQEW